MKPSHPALTAEAVVRIDQLYTAAGDLQLRADDHYDFGRNLRARRCMRAVGRLQSRAWKLMLSQLSGTELTRLVSLNNEKLAAARKAA